jgi:hypothetical protein
MFFKDTSEFAYLSTLCNLSDVLLEMLDKKEFTQEQLDKILPQLEQAVNILNMNREDLNKKSYKELN